MKKHFLKLFAIVALAGFVFTACQKEELPTAAKLAGTYQVSDVVTGYDAGTYTYTVTVTASSTDEAKIIIQNFGGFPTAITVNANITDKTLSIPAQIPTQWSSLQVTGTIAGTGTTTDASNIGVISYTITYSDGDVSVGTATYTKQ